MNEDLHNRVMQVIDHLRGSSTGIAQGFDQAIEDDETLTQEEYDTNEIAIHDLIDNNIFECVTCGWTLNVDEMGEDTDSGEIQCLDCQD
jgi:hypothetical protein